MQTIPLQPVTSSQIHAIGYDDATKTLAVQFHGKAGPGSTYHYSDVPPEKFLELKRSESIGKYFGAHIKNGGYKYAKLGAKAA